jgi:hypothetical protein
MVAAAGSVAQEVYVDPKDQAFRAKYENIDLAGMFSALALSDDQNNYYIADFTLLEGKFEKVWFLNLVFKGDKVVNIDPDILQKRVWFLAVKSIPEKTVNDYLLSLKEKTLKASATFTEGEKSEWLQKNDKYR